MLINIKNKELKIKIKNLEQKEENIDNFEKTKNLHLETINQLKSKDLELLINTQNLKNNVIIFWMKKQLDIKIVSTKNSLKIIQILIMKKIIKL